MCYKVERVDESKCEPDKDHLPLFRLPSSIPGGGVIGDVTVDTGFYDANDVYRKIASMKHPLTNYGIQQMATQWAGDKPLPVHWKDKDLRELYAYAHRLKPFPWKTFIMGMV